ncbi:cobalt ECF transporter T component CbiQ [Alkalibacter rhizosphaerae]|uniref:Cobalt ECF transporter T component CbiQ n=1 Tax=Alkalibacter rhizosphaerae TaxID=2815577 RepID=A0A974XFF5_9FIRM|nr:cobalt ECF transporter T component CbiQ [Alkalibacter rhizosphaerae]QSX08833.1 cobalt ECF transporter T component CbiQ [Alkalibacter rhizosphaerae]
MLDMDAYAYSNKMAERSAEWKLGFALLGLTSSLLTSKGLLHMIVVITMTVMVIGFARIPWRAYVQLYLIPVSFLLLSVLTLLVSISGSGDGLEWYWKMGNYHIGISRESIRIVGVLTGRCVASLSCLYFLSLTTPLNQLVGVLKRFRFPVILIELIVLIYRFLHIFLASVHDSYHALQLRNGFATMKISRKSLAMLVVMTYSKMMESYNDWQMVLATKNFNGDFHV